MFSKLFQNPSPDPKKSAGQRFNSRINYRYAEYQTIAKHISIAVKASQNLLEIDLKQILELEVLFK